MDPENDIQKDPLDQPIKSHGFTGRAAGGIKASPLIESLGPNPVQSLQENPGFELIKAKPDKGSRVYRTVTDIGVGDEELFIKTFDSRETFRVMADRMLGKKGLKRPAHYPRKMLGILLQKSAAKRSWKVASACRNAGIPVSDHLFYLSRRRGVFWEEVIASRGVNPRSSENARHFFNARMQAPRDKRMRALKRELIKELGSLLWKVARSGIMFPDFKLHNLVLQEPPDAAPRFVVIDLSEARIDPRYPEDVFLERFAVRLPGPAIFTRTDHVRLVKAYLDAGDDMRGFYEVCEAISKRARKQGRKMEMRLRNS